MSTATPPKIFSTPVLFMLLLLLLSLLGLVIVKPRQNYVIEKHFTCSLYKCLARWIQFWNKMKKKNVSNRMGIERDDVSQTFANMYVLNIILLYRCILHTHTETVWVILRVCGRQQEGRNIPHSVKKKKKKTTNIIRWTVGAA